MDAPDLHLILQPEIETREDFFSGHEAVIDPAGCTRCGLCEEICRYQAVISTSDGFSINPLKCEGCKVCVHFCPAQTIRFPERHCGRWFISRTRFGPLVHAQLFPGAENSGRLVALLRQKARELAAQTGRALILSDGSPGIGCPVISSLTGTDAAVLVTEPTPSGLHDLQRVADLCRHFTIPIGVIVNKADLNPEATEAVHALVCGGEGRFSRRPALRPGRDRGHGPTAGRHRIFRQRVVRAHPHCLVQNYRVDATDSITPDGRNGLPCKIKP